MSDELIDWSALAKAYEQDGVYAVQLEVGDLCNQGCSYCYANALPTVRNELTDEDVEGVLRDASALGATAIEWLGGEPLLRPSVFEHMELARELGLRNNVWTGGLPLADPDVRKEVARLARPGLVSIHVPTVNPELWERLHPGRTAADLEAILAGLRALVDEEGYPASQVLNSTTFTGLQPVEDAMATMDFFKEMGVATSLNVYHTYLRPGTPPGELAKFIPKRRDVATLYAHYARMQGARQLPMNCVNQQYCSATCAVLCDGSVTPCATIRDPSAPKLGRDGTLAQILENYRNYLLVLELKDVSRRPKPCASCRLAGECWGCRSRAYAAGNGLLGADPRCFRSGSRLGSSSTPP
ncbi:MAG: radical SAM protein [Promethearchaeota archaeon]